MKKLTSFFLVCLFAGQAFSQIQPENPDPFLFRPVTHSGNLKSSENKLQGKSFYQSKDDWQTIIDNTWGPGLPLNEKLAIFDTYTGALTAGFEGFNSLGIDPTEWNSIKNSYRSSINSSTSKGAFAALMGRLANDLCDIHTHAWDTTVLFTPLDPGIPILVIGAWEISHFGAVLTVLPDSSLLVLRTIDDHPLGLQSGDIILGYEGIPWKDLVDELLGSGIPILSLQRNSKSAVRHNELASAGMNWHLFETIDIVKYASGDSVHLPVYPLQNLVVPTVHIFSGGKFLLWPNEQLPVPGVPLPDPLVNNQYVTYGIVEGTNIGYIYLYAETDLIDDQFYKAVKSLSGTEGLIIDLRLNFGGSPIPFKGLNLLFNARQYTLEDVQRCSQFNFSLCSANDQNYFRIMGDPMSWYDRPLAVLIGPNTISSGDYIAYMLDYHPMVQFFGKSTCGALGSWTDANINIPEWGFWYTSQSAVRISDPEIFLNRREFPVDDSVWFDAESVDAGKDAVVEKAMEWIQNLSYAHNVLANPGYVIPGTGTVTVTAKVENPNGHNLSVNARFTSMDSTITDTVSLFDDGNNNDGDPGDGIWGALWPVPEMKTIFAVDITTEDLIASTSRSITGAAKFTTIGPIVVDGITYTKSDTIPNCGEKIYFKVSLRNDDSTASVDKVLAKLTSLNTALANLPYAYVGFADIAPGEIKTHSASYYITISEDCPANTKIPVKVDIFSGDYYLFSSDTFTITVRGPEITAEDDTIYDGGQTSIDISSVQVSSQAVYYTYTSAPENAGAVTGFTSNTEGLPITKNILDTLFNTTEQSQRLVYTITPYILRSDNSIGCAGTDMTVNILVEPWGENTEEISKPMTRIYPNPAADIINIEIGNTGEQEIVIELLNVSGQLVYKREFKNNKDPLVKQINLSSYAKGVYFLRIRQSGTVYNGKIIVM